MSQSQKFMTEFTKVILTWQRKGRMIVPNRAINRVRFNCGIRQFGFFALLAASSKLSPRLNQALVRAQACMVVTTHSKGRRVSGLLVRVANVRRYFPRHVEVI